MTWVDISPYRVTVTKAAYELAHRLVDWPLTNQQTHDPMVILGDCLLGKMAEAGYAVAAGLDVKLLHDDGPGLVDFTTPIGDVDVKAIRHDRDAFNVSVVDSHVRRPGAVFAGVRVKTGIWKAEVLGTVPVTVVQQLPVQPPSGRKSGYWRVPTDILDPVRRAS